MTDTLNDEQRVVQTDNNGEYFIVGLDSGQYTLRFEKEQFQLYIQRDINLQPLQTIRANVTLAPHSSDTHPSSRVIRLDYTNNIHQTHLDENQIHHFPTAHNVWSLIENQDLSATTNRIDVGGLWGLQPALFSSRGSCSWTQNVYLLNGFDVSDPFWTGQPLFFPDFFSLKHTQLINAGQPPFALSPGATYILTTKEGTETFSGNMSTSFIRPILQSSNITPLLEREGIIESHTFDYYSDGNIQLSGPIVPGRLYFYTSASAFSIGRNLADYDFLDKNSALSGLFSLKYRLDNSVLKFLWTGQTLSYPTFGAGRGIALSSTNNRKDAYNILQMMWEKRFADNHALMAGLSLALGSQHLGLQQDQFSPHGEDIFTGIGTGTAPFETDNKRYSLSFQVRGESLLPHLFSALHKFQYGFQIKSSGSGSQMDAIDNYHFYTFDGNPIQVALLNTPVHHREASLGMNFYVQDTMTLSSFLSFYFGLNFDVIRGRVPKGSGTASVQSDLNPQINWANLSPRLGFVIPLSSQKLSALKISVARYFHTLPLNYLTYGNPDSWGAEVYIWDDVSSDGFFQEEERGLLLRQEGPIYAHIDPELSRPFTDELSVSYVHTFGKQWTFTFSGFYRKTKNLIETTNIGIPDSAYDEVLLEDIGDDRIQDTHDDLLFTVYNQNSSTLGQDAYLLTNADSPQRRSRYLGLDLTLIRRYGERFTFFLSLQAINVLAVTNPGNTEWENDDGVIGSLYDNPNTLINADGRPRFDRGYTGRVGLTYLAPFGIQTGLIVKYYDGQPFARKIIVTDMNQGPFYIQAHPRGKARYEFNMTIDIRIEKVINIGISRLRIFVDGFNIANMPQATEENEWTGPNFPLRYATEIQSPRVFRLGLAYEF